MAVIIGGSRRDTQTEPGAPAREIAELLAGRGFTIDGPKREESLLLTVTNARRARCEIDIDDERVVWEYLPARGAAIGAAEISGIVLRVLDAGDADPIELDARLRQGLTLKGAVACAMRARGLAADLNVYEDQVCYDVAAEVVITNPAKRERGLVRVTDDGTVRWECDATDMPDSVAAIAHATGDALGQAGGTATRT